MLAVLTYSQHKYQTTEKFDLSSLKHFNVIATYCKSDMADLQLCENKRHSCFQRWNLMPSRINMGIKQRASQPSHQPIRTLQCRSQVTQVQAVNLPQNVASVVWRLCLFVPCWENASQSALTKFPNFCLFTILGHYQQEL